MGMELLRGGSLRHFLNSHESKKITDIKASKIMKGILSAVTYIHEKGIIHRDLKTENILIAKDADVSSVKIIDFGFGKKSMATFSNSTNHVGTLVYMAPEVAFQHEYTKSVDIWAIGIIMHKVLTRDKHPFHSRKDNPRIFK